MDQNSKPPLVFVHGFRGAPIGLQTIADQLNDYGYQTYLPAIPPFANTKPLECYDIKHYVEYLRSYLTENHITKPILIGHSMGSIICAAAGEHCAELLDDKLILLSPISAHTSPVLSAISSLSAILPRKTVDYATTRFLFVPKNHQLFRQTMTITHACSVDSTATHHDEIAAARFSTHHAVGDFHPPQHTLLLAGAHDKLVPRIATEQLSAQLKHAQTYFIPNSGHLHNYEAPLETASAIRQFVEQKPQDSFSV